MHWNRRIFVRQHYINFYITTSLTGNICPKLGLSGVCREVDNCYGIWKKLKKFPSHKLRFAETEIIKAAQCGEKKEVPLVCCPECGIPKVQEFADRVVSGRPARLGNFS